MLLWSIYWFRNFKESDQKDFIVFSLLINLKNFYLYLDLIFALKLYFLVLILII